MGNINLITPPDILYDHTFSILLICPNNTQKKEIQDIFAHQEKDYNIYFYDKKENGIEDIDWLLTLHRICDFVFINIDSVCSDIKILITYLISFSNTHWYTQGHTNLYTKISRNQIFTFDNLKKKLTGDLVEI